MLKENNILFLTWMNLKRLQNITLEYGRISKAKRALEIGLSQHPDASSLKLLNAEQLVFEDRLEEASEILNELLVLEPMNAEVHAQQANLYSKMNKHHRAIELLQYALTLTDDASNIYALIAMEYLYGEDYTNAKTILSMFRTKTLRTIQRYNSQYSVMKFQAMYKRLLLS